MCRLSGGGASRERTILCQEQGNIQGKYRRVCDFASNVDPKPSTRVRVTTSNRWEQLLPTGNNRELTTLQTNKTVFQSDQLFLIQIHLGRSGVPRSHQRRVHILYVRDALRGEAGRDCTPRSSERSRLALPARCDTLPSTLPLPSNCDGTVRCSCCLPGDDRPCVDG